MKKVLLFLFLLPHLIFSQGVNITSWKVNTTGHQAQYYNSSNVVQNLNDSSEVLELCYNTDTVYIRTSFLASYIMGDWPGDPFLADGQNKTYNIPRNPTYPVSTGHKAKPTSITGLLLNGVPIYDDGDGKSYNSSTNKNENSGSGVWNQLAWIAHAAEMDAGNCHPDPNKNYHTHFNPIMLYDASASTVHSPIIGWAFDGFPIYGPFGYSTATNSSSAIKRMTSSWSLRNITTRTTLYTGATASQTGPTVSATFPLGTYKEDYQYVANAGDLDYYNGRYCVTPEFPSGTYAYFLNTDASGNASYPNMIGPSYYGNKTYAGITGPTSGNATKPKTSITCVSGSMPTVTLSTGTSSISEASGATTVTATLSASYSSAVAVTLTLSGTATTSTDYTLSTTITVPAGSTSASITLAAVQDATYEGNETVIIDITAVSNGSESGTQQRTVTIADDDAAPTVTLSTGVSSIAEAAGTTTVTATLSNASTSAVTVNLALSGTATVNTDYTLATSITIAAGSTSGSLTLTAVQDASAETHETIVIDISTVTNGTESGTQQKTVTITDDDSGPVVTIATGASSVSEAAGTTTVTATLSVSTASAVTVNLALSGTATVASDYTLATSITIPSGSTSASITLTAVQDVLSEGNETIVIDISTVTNATESGTQQKTVTITDDEVNTTSPIISEWIMNANGKKASYWLTAGSGQNVTYTYTASTDSADVLQLCYSADSVWVRSDGLTNDMGKYLNPGSCLAQDYIFRFPRNPVVPVTKSKSPYTGAIGLLLNGIPVYGLSNSNSWTGSAMSPMGQGIWNAEVGYTEGFVLDTAFGAHPQQDGAYHTHATPFRLYKDVATTQHSPIVGYAFDGYPIYGPYGYSSATDAGSAVTRMKSGYALRNISSRTTLPNGTTASQTGPSISATYPLGYFIEDYAWSAANGGDLDEYNGRFCVTPEYPEGTYAYFTTVTSAGAAQFPYYIGPYYYGAPEDDNLAINPTIKIPSTGTSCSANPTVTLSTGASSVSENAGTTTVTATLSATSIYPVTVTIAMTGTATVTNDYTLATSIVIPAGSTSASINLASVQDAVYEGNETVIIDITAVSNATESGTQQKTVSITDDETVPTVTLGTGTGSIGEANASTTVTATLSTASASAVTVTLSVSGTATVTNDYTLSTSISIPAGSTSASINLTSVQDAVYEGNETVIIDIATVNNATESGTQQKTVAISDDDAAPTVTIAWSNTSIGEAITGTSNAVVTLSAASAMTTTVTVAFSGTAMLNSDYTVTGTTITIAAGSTTGFVTMNNIPDNLYEGNENITVDIASVINATEVGTQNASMTVNDDDAMPAVVLSVGASSVSEATGTTTITATLSAASGLATTVTISTSGTAASALDYTLASTTITIPAGSSSASTSVTAIEDVTYEGNETVIIDITGVTNGTESGTQQGTISIIDNDQPMLEVYEGVELYNHNDTLKFGAVNLSGGDKSMTLSLKNSGTSALQIDSIKLRNNANGFFMINTSGVDMNLAENETTDITITFDNACANSSDKETVVIYSNGAISTYNVVLKANSKDDVKPVVATASLPALSFECPDFTLTAPTATDNCSGTITGTTPALNLSTSYQGTMTITWSYTDAAGNVTTQDQEITVEDVTAPTLTCPGNITIDSDVDVAVPYTVPVPVENCSGHSLVINDNAFTSGSMFAPNTSNTVQYTVTDIGGNTASCSFDIIVSPITSAYSSVELSQSVNIYPNPGEGMIKISLTRISADVQIFDSKGILVKTIENLSSETEIDLSSSGAGMYQAVFSTESGARFTKVITVIK